MANSEIDKLKQRIKELEKQLQKPEVEEKSIENYRKSHDTETLEIMLEYFHRGFHIQEISREIDMRKHKGTERLLFEIQLRSQYLLKDREVGFMSYLFAILREVLRNPDCTILETLKGDEFNMISGYFLPEIFDNKNIRDPHTLIKLFLLDISIVCDKLELQRMARNNKEDIPNTVDWRKYYRNCGTKTVVTETEEKWEVKKVPKETPIPYIKIPEFRDQIKEKEEKRKKIIEEYPEDDPKVQKFPTYTKIKGTKIKFKNNLKPKSK